jgi:SAM-dependent methyltransferase
MNRAEQKFNSRYRAWREESMSLTPEVERQRLGRRELDTFKTLCSVSGRYPEIFGDVGGALLDLGCGDQYLRAPSESAGLTYRGIDVDECDFDCDPLPVLDEQYDVVVSLAVIEHLTNPGNFLAEISRVLRSGGTLILSTPNWGYCVKTFWNDPTHVKPYTRESLARVVQIAGFSEVAVFPGLRCKPAYCYRGTTAFWRARWLFPFRGDHKWAPSLLRGRSTSLFLVATR